MRFSQIHFAATQRSRKLPSLQWNEIKAWKWNSAGNSRGHSPHGFKGRMPQLKPANGTLKANCTEKLYALKTLLCV